MPRVNTVRQRDLDRVMKALSQRGQPVARVEVKPSGDIVVIPVLPGGVAEEPKTALEEWRMKRALRSAEGS